MPDAAPLEPGDPASLGQYEVVGRLGAGGQGAVYLGQTPGNEYVAIKLLHAQMSADPAARARFIREVSAAQRVAPFCTARVLESDVHGDQPYIVSEFIDGPSLHDVVVQQRPFGPQDLDRLAIGTVTALAAIHEAGIVHRDFKPNNVLLAADGPRVVDFGIARTVNSQESAVTATGMVVGTPGYLAPEQLTGAPLMPSVDIFAWAATMVFAATGQSPFEADTLPVIINRILHDDPDLSALHSPLREVVGRCLSKDPARRPASHQLLLQLLGNAGAAPGPAPAREELLDQGTRIAAQMPAPPPIAPGPPPPPITPNPPMSMPGPMTPPPMPMYQGPVTPPPIAMHQGPMNRPPMAPRPPMQPPYPPPAPRGSNSNGPLIAGVGCVVVALVVILLVALGVAMNNDDADPETSYTPYSYRPYSYTPYSYTPFSLTPFSSRLLHSNFGGTWKGNGYQSQGGTSSWDITLTLTSGNLTGRIEYDNGKCSGITLVDSSSPSKTVLRDTITRNAGNCYTSGYVTLYYSTSTSVRFEWRRYSAAGTPWASGLLRKQ
ncbi:serine/threonine-protein kinase [Actinomadura sp. HBU206391]|uniref:serine/threonine-protein kinase n=1 Tax=Actinomadura sp. HBU206391 TaxID=2731692 RepID=UPI001650565F|nr:serine/threonine-protein kinase [Actinomadura sp. HBU206391]MBC6458799.1 protein kinase [Actinomadura sp. HBU206391]